MKALVTAFCGVIFVAACAETATTPAVPASVQRPATAPAAAAPGAAQRPVTAPTPAASGQPLERSAITQTDAVAADGSTFERETSAAFADLWQVEHAAQPVFPADALRKGQPGCALVRFHVSSRGVPRDVRVIREWPPLTGFGDAAVESVSNWRFHPTPQNADSSPTRAEQMIAFGLETFTPNGEELEARCEPPDPVQD